MTTELKQAVEYAFYFDVAYQSINGEKQLSVCSSQLHDQLGVKTPHTMWFDRRITEYGFVENEDFVCFTNLLSKSGRGGHNQKEYWLTLDMAKELCMVEKTDKGRQARQYFLACEKKLQTKNSIAETTETVLPKYKAVDLIRFKNIFDFLEGLNLKSGVHQLIALENANSGVKNLSGVDFLKLAKVNKTARQYSPRHLDSQSQNSLFN